MYARQKFVQRLLQFTALYLALTCLWMSTVVALRHTDDVDMFQTYRVTSSHVSTPGHVVAHPECLAHKWMDASRFHHVAAVPAILAPPSPLDTISVRIRTSHSSARSYTALRGPPAIV